MAPVAVDGATVAALLRGELSMARPPDAGPGRPPGLDAARPAAACREADLDDEVEGDDVHVAQLEAELATTEMAQSFDRPDDEGLADADFNLVKNPLGVEAQDGRGPARRRCCSSWARAAGGR